MRTFKWISAITLTCLSFALLGGGLQPARAAQSSTGQPSADSFEALHTLAEQDGSVQVIVRLKTLAPFAPEGGLGGAAADNQKAGIARAQAAIEAALKGKNATVIAKYKHVPFMALKLDPAALDQLRNSGLIEDFQLDKAIPPALVTETNIVHANSMWTLGYDGDGWVVAILDTGIDRNHPFFGNRIVYEECHSNANGVAGKVSLCPNGTGSQTGAGAANAETAQCWVSGDNYCDHGTHVAGIAAGDATGVPGASGSGVAPHAQIVAIQVFTRFNSSGDCAPYAAPCMLSYYSDQIAALDSIYALRSTYNFSSVNISIGGGSYTSYCDSNGPAFAAYFASIGNLWSNDIPTMISAGNDGTNYAVGFPACLSNAVTIGATTDSDSPTSYTNGGAMVDLYAPGDWITSSIPDNSFGPMSGTSMAAPMVTGAFAALREARASDDVGDLLNAFQATGPTINYGASRRRIDLIAALNEREGNNAPNTPSNPVPADTISNVSILPNLQWTGGDPDFGDAVTYDVYTGLTSGSVTTLRCDDTPFTACYVSSGLSSEHYWKVVAKDSHGTTTAGPVWSFDFGGPPPICEPYNGSPNGGILLPTNAIVLSWSCGGGATPTFDVKINSGSVTTLLCNDISTTSCTIPANTLSYNTPYAWTVEATNAYGFFESTSYSFTTINGPFLTNNDFFQPVVIPAQLPYMVNQDTTAATTNGNDPLFPCRFSGAAQGSHTVWYKFIPSVNGTLHLDTLAGDYDSILAVWTGSSPTALSNKACNDDYNASQGYLQSALSVNVSAGTTYYIEVAGWSSGDYGDLWLRAYLTTSCTAPAKPAQSTPANAAAFNTASHSFTWATVANASQYEFQLSGTSNFASLIDSYTGPNTNYTSNASLADGTYYWRVQARNNAYGCNAVSGFSAARTLIQDTIAPSTAPTLVSPAVNSAVTTRTPKLTVAALTGAAGYEYQFGSDGTFSTTTTASSTSTSYTLTAGQALAYGQNYWRARARDAAGNWSAWSSGNLFLVTIQAAPLNGSFSTATKPAFKWVGVSGALQYQLQVADEAGFGSPVIDLTRAANMGTAFTPTTPLDFGNYFWRMRVQTSGGWSSWMPVMTFGVTPILPLAPVLTGPAANAATNNNPLPVFTWNSVANGLKYQIQIDTTNKFLNTNMVNVTLAPGVLTFTPGGPLTGGNKYWRVRALNYLNAPGAWSTVRTLVVDVTAPAPPALSSPAANAIISGTPAFSWGMASTATAYQFEYATNTLFTTGVYSAPVSAALNHTPPAITPGVIYWHVKARDAAGNWSAFSTYRQVTINLPAVVAAPVLTGPAANAATNNNPLPVFTWNAVPYGITYEIQIDTVNTFNSVNLMDQTLGVGVLTYTPGGPLTAGNKYWRVRAINSNSQPGTWSAARTLMVDLTPPGVPALSSPADGAPVNGTPQFAWLAASSATGYQFEYATDSGFTTGKVTSPVITALKYTPPAIPLGTYYWHVIARDAAGNTTASLTRTVTINPLAMLAAPVLTGPAANAATNNNPLPVFTWNAVPYGSTYQIQIDTVNTFVNAGKIDQTLGVGVLTFTPGGPLAAGNKYWRVRAINANSVPGTWSAARTLVVDLTPPLAPALSSPAANAVVSGTPVFSWMAASSANAYQFEYATDTGFTTGKYTSPVIATLTHIPPAIPPGVYYWHAASRDAAGNWSAFSAYRQVTINPPVPAAPVLTAPANGSTATSDPTLTWNAVPYGATYQVQMDTVSTFSSPDFNDTSAAANLTPTGLPNATYFWRVRAYNSSSVAGPWSAVWVVTLTLPPAAPSGLTAAADSQTAITLNWTDNASDEDGFSIERSADGSTGWTEIDTVGSNVTTFQDTGLTCGTAYYYRVIAQNGNGDSAASNVANDTTVVCAPAAPSGLTAGADSDTAITLNWTDNASNEASFRIERSADGSTGWTEINSVGTDVTTYQDTGLTCNTTYYYRVFARNAGGDSSTTSVASDTTDACPPPPTAPSGLTVTPDSQTELTLNWTDNSSDEVTFHIERSDDGSTGWMEIDSVGAGVTTYQDTGLTCGTTYYYRVFARNTGGDSSPTSVANDSTNMCGTAWLQGKAIMGIGACTGNGQEAVQITGSSINIVGGLHSNGDASVSGTGTTVDGGATAVGTFDGGTASYNPSPQSGVSAVTVPDLWTITDFAPGGSVATVADGFGKYYYFNGTVDDWSDFSGGGHPKDGVYYAEGGFNMTSADLDSVDMNGVTLASPGTFDLVFSNASNLLVPWLIPAGYDNEAGTNQLPAIFSSAGDQTCGSSNDAVNISGNLSSLGAFYTPNGQLNISFSSGTLLQGSLMGYTVNLAGSDFSITYDPDLLPLIP